jgi:hypothetical protein
MIMKKAMLFASAAIIGVSVLATHANAQGVSQSVEITKVDVQRVAAGYRASKVIGSSVANDANETISGRCRENRDEKTVKKESTPLFDVGLKWPKRSDCQ